MKEFSEYKTGDEYVLDLAAEGLIQYTKAGKLVLPVRPHRPNKGIIEKFMLGIVDAIARSPHGKVLSGAMMKMLRGDNHPNEFKIASRLLVEDRKIVVSKYVTANVGRPCVYYTLWEA